MDAFEKFSMQFYFKVSQTDQDLTSLIFANKNKIFEFNYETQEIRDVIVYDKAMNRQLEFFTMNQKQNIAIVASKDDGLYCNF